MKQACLIAGLWLAACGLTRADDYVAKTLYDAAVKDFQAGRCEPALKLLGRALSEKEQYPEARCLVGQCYEKLGQNGKALEAYRTCVAHTGKEEQPPAAAQARQHALQRIIELDEDQRKLEEIKDEAAERMLNAAKEFAGKGNHRASMQACALVLKWLPEHSDAREALGRALANLPFDERYVEFYSAANLAHKAEASVINGGTNQAMGGGPLFSAFDGNPVTWWTCESRGAGTALLLEWPTPARIRAAVLTEEGLKRTRYKLQCPGPEGWRDLTDVLLHRGDRQKRIVRFDDLTTSALRVMQVSNDTGVMGLSFREIVIIGE